MAMGDGKGVREGVHALYTGMWLDSEGVCCQFIAMSHVWTSIVCESLNTTSRSVRITPIL